MANNSEELVNMHGVNVANLCLGEEGEKKVKNSLQEKTTYK